MADSECCGTRFTKRRNAWPPKKGKKRGTLCALARTSQPPSRGPPGTQHKVRTRAAARRPPPLVVSGSDQSDSGMRGSRRPRASPLFARLVELCKPGGGAVPAARAAGGAAARGCTRRARAKPKKRACEVICGAGGALPFSAPRDAARFGRSAAAVHHGTQRRPLQPDGSRVICRAQFACERMRR